MTLALVRGNTETFFFSLPLTTYCIKHKNGGFALGGDEEAQQGLAALGVVVEVDVPDAP